MTLLLRILMMAACFDAILDSLFLAVDCDKVSWLMQGVSFGGHEHLNHT